MLRVAVVGSGPAGVYAAGALAEHHEAVDVFDRLPCPFGLVRYGVAPDHEKIRSITSTLHRVFEQPNVRFLGNVEVGRDVTVEELHAHYDAVLVACGSALGRRLGVPGEDLPGSFSATDFVAWYCGHPDAMVDRFTLEARSVVVVGLGNVALDVARLLAKDIDALRQTDMPDHVLRVLADSKVEEVSIVGRRGPAQARFSTKELRELGDIAGADVIVDPADLELDEGSAAAVGADPTLRRNLDVLRGWAERPPAGRPRRVHLRFFQRPDAVLGEGQVSGVQLERNVLDGSGGVRGTGQLSVVDAQLVLCSVGYRGLAIPGLPFDERDGVIPNAGGRVLRDGVPVPGEYVAGWIKRGPTGVIGTNKHDAHETVAALLEDLPHLPRAAYREPEDVDRLLAGRGVQVVGWAGWCAIDGAELALGVASGRRRVKISEREALLRAAAADSASR
ncbi:FAD-dependent oxidoreductase [Motilibacter deserti]|uniref:ferredoxin--NADP(+) reductase n=1 Tax=Motilibacter deserti TaxID=2714956 RepID=A0ABX0GX51_9ACTN|nr:FAD-dependent oxidoreductase [Motilibacter deserti]NHC14177.1 FAD-dependent oxidoreductase [Motilibacter deserti]